MFRRVTNALLSALIAPPCAVCARVLDAPLEGAVCPFCWSGVAAGPSASFLLSDSIATGCAIGEYDGRLRDIIHALKYDGRRSVATRLSAMMAVRGGVVLDGADVIVPVPLHPRRHRERGFNQSDDLARGLGLQVTRVLRRTRMTRAQVELPAGERHRNVAGAFEIERPDITGTTIVLVDDVTTTGATLEACARVLLAAGAREVRALTAARVATGPR